MGRLSLTGYNITLKTLIEEKHNMADMYNIVMHDLSGDKKELLMRLASRERESALLLTEEYKALFCAVPDLSPIQRDSSITLNDLIRLEADNALLLSRMSKNAPNSRLSQLYASMAEKATNNGYLLLLIL